MTVCMCVHTRIYAFTHHLPNHILLQAVIMNDTVESSFNSSSFRVIPYLMFCCSIPVVTVLSSYLALFHIHCLHLFSPRLTLNWEFTVILNVRSALLLHVTGNVFMNVIPKVYGLESLNSSQCIPISAICCLLVSWKLCICLSNLGSD
jgi:hypothetical protein